MAPLASQYHSLVEKVKNSKVEDVLSILTEDEICLIADATDLLYIPTWFKLVCL
jgi:hypothetical protein